MNIVVYATTGDRDYEFYAPIVAHAWRVLGWEPVVGVSGVSSLVSETLQRMRVRQIVIHSARKPATAAQTCRIYIPSSFPSDYVMTSDVDMIPLSKAWSTDGANRITGWDITGYGEIPICYVAALGTVWRQFMQPADPHDWESSMEQGLTGLGHNAESWSADQIILTRQILSFGKGKFQIVSRTNRPGLARVCRSNWKDGMHRLASGPQIDCHVLRPINWVETRKVLVLAGLHAPWMDNYAAAY